MNRLWLCCILLLMLSCKEAGKKNIRATKQPVKDPYAIPPEPDPFVTRRGLFDFFERHKHLDAFDTLDGSISSYWGIVHHPGATVEAGHLFSDKQIHAAIYYSDEIGDGLFIYMKNDTGWAKIFEDTAISFYGPHAPTYSDWNGDGVKDLSISRTGMMDKDYTYDLWLMGKDGRQLQEVEGFGEIRNPEPAKQPGYLDAGYYHHSERIQQYRFKGTKLEEVYNVYIGYNDEAKDPDSMWVVSITQEGHKDLTLYGNNTSLHKKVPAKFRAKVKQSLSQQ